MAPPRGCREDCGHFQSGRAGLHAIHNQIQHCHRIAPITVSSIAPKQQSLLQCLEQLKRTFCLIHLFKWTAETINWQQCSASVVTLLCLRVLLWGNTNAWSSGAEDVQMHLGHPPVAGWTGAEAGGMDPCGPTTVLPEKVN